MSKTFKLVFSLAIPIAFQSLIQSSLSIIDQVMVSRLGGSAMAAAGLALRPLTILFFTFMAISGALTIFVAQFWGDKQYDKIKPVIKLSVIYGFIILIPVLLFSIIAPGSVMKLFSKDVEVIEYGIGYLKILSMSFFPLMLVMVFSAALKSCGMIRVPVIAGVTAVISNTVLNYILIYGVGNIQGFGIEGAAMATVAARVIEAAIIIICFFKLGIINKKVKMKDDNDGKNEIHSKFRKVAYPLIVSEIVFIGSITFYAVLYGRMGTSQMAAMTVLVPLQNVAFGIFAGLSTAASTLIGQSLGRGDFDKAKHLARKIMKYTLILTISFSLLLLMALPYYLELFQLETNIQTQAYTLIFVAMIILPIQIMNMVIYEGVLRTGGETGYLIKIQLLTLTAIGIPAGIIAALLLKLPLHIVFLAVSFEEIVRLSISYYKMRKGVWIAKLTD
ncbi:MAG: MATE family efflux transporter [Spirochaetaceae bacterium]